MALSPYLYGDLDGRIEADLQNNPWWELYAGAELGLGIEAEILGKEIFDFNTNPPLINFEQLVASASISNPPTANFYSNTTSGIAPLTVNFTDQSINEPTSWQWDFGDGGTSAQQNPSHIYNEDGSYTVSLTVSNNNGHDTKTIANYINVNGGSGSNILTEDFEDNNLHPNISIIETGTYNASPNIKNRVELGSNYSYGFGKSTCSANCFDNYTTEMIIDFGTPRYVNSINFKIMELDGDWGSSGNVYIDGVKVEDVQLGNSPSNDHIPDLEPRYINISVDSQVTEIRIYVRDITNKSEIFLDDLVIVGE